MKRDRRWTLKPLSFLLALALGAPGGGSAQEVTLPLERYDQLRAKAFAEAPEPPPPAVPVAFEEAMLEVEVGEARALVRQRLTLSVRGEAWQTLSLPALGTFVSAQLGDLEGVVRPGSPWALHLTGEGRHQLVLESVVPVEEDTAAVRPTWHMELELPRAAAVRTEIVAAAGIDELEASAGALVVQQGKNRWSLVAEPGEVVALTLLGAAAAPERSDRPLAFEASVATAQEVRRTATRADAWITLRIRQGSLESVEIPLPEHLELVDVAGESLGGWEVEEGRAKIQPRRPMTGEWEVRLSFAGPPVTTFSDLVLAPDGAASVRYFAKARVRGDGLLSLASPGSGRWAEARQEARLPLAFRETEGRTSAVADPGNPPRWEVSWADGAEVLAAQVDLLTVEVLVGESGRAFYQLWAEVRSSGAAALDVEAPAAFELTASHRDGVELTPGRQGTSLRLPLRRADTPQIVYLAGFLPLPLPAGGGRFEVPLPSFSAPVAEV
ncbi:MAG: hypothetical protein KDD47_22665, partial [Acidobacteria bacterium]|nr:hypothetical protein [Acidobacteriota bacterium]